MKKHTVRAPERTVFVCIDRRDNEQITSDPAQVDEYIRKGGRLVAEIQGRDFSVEAHE